MATLARFERALFITGDGLVVRFQATLPEFSAGDQRYLARDDKVMRALQGELPLVI